MDPLLTFNVSSFIVIGLGVVFVATKLIAIEERMKGSKEARIKLEDNKDKDCVEITKGRRKLEDDWRKLEDDRRKLEDDLRKLEDDRRKFEDDCRRSEDDRRRSEDKLTDDRRRIEDDRRKFKNDRCRSEEKFEDKCLKFEDERRAFEDERLKVQEQHCKFRDQHFQFREKVKELMHEKLYFGQARANHHIMESIMQGSNVPNGKLQTRHQAPLHAVPITPATSPSEVYDPTKSITDCIDRVLDSALSISDCIGDICKSEYAFTFDYPIASPSSSSTLCTTTAVDSA